ncbi:MAG: ribosome small subunit-dependent GTPase A [Candidatus Cyclonatronum sp.]|uniref:ribosome small subunit-dependent GTPase A n=1 Tax=Cyclonatronum sp. TaxID=3024185 RepID=UPI0025C315F2|nr:ribosome small subunit-dependent GTPase A [Cyclonatronum sp.]MCC5933092.1 ribosome small subunit-dependent GTPase A [Balneolales bacterium]MCH8486391.1 ribosome small subunit-dependent GTPase A [Cyclonatronum sp.]
MKRGRIIKSTGKWYKVMPFEENAEVISCQIPGKFRLQELQQTNPIAVGDLVSFRVLEDGSGMIEDIEARKNKISRKATHGRKGEQILVSNVDQAFVVQAVQQPQFRTGFIDRFIISAEAHHIRPIIILNKTDLGTDEDADLVADLIKIYDALSYQLILTSIYDDESIEELRSLMKDRTSVFIGPSGTGKTSLLNTIQPGMNRTVAAVSTFSNKGKHTTTFAELIPLDFGGFLADTPGIREFGLVGFDLNEISGFFPEMRILQQNCRFYNCTHLHEPGCAVMEAFGKGKIAASRYDSYISIYESLEDENRSAGSRKRG